MDDLTELVIDLTAINSVNPDLVAGAPGEGEVARYIAVWLERFGMEVHLEEVAPGRPNVIGIARGGGGGPTLMLNGHLDTVGAGGMLHPHNPSMSRGRLYGRGAYDMKGGIAACMWAAAEARRLGLRGDVVFAGVMDEEYAGLGTLSVAERYRADAAVVAEPTELRLITAHKGFVWLEVETLGVAAHGSRPDLGVDAIVRMGRILAALEQLEAGLRAGPGHALLGTGSLHASVIAGGREPSTYPESCVLSYERRTIPGETPESVAAELDAIIARLERADPSFKAVVRRRLDRAPMETLPDAEIVQAVTHSATDVLGHPPDMAGVAYWTDAATLSQAGIPSVLFGPAGAGAHANEEWVDLASVRACAEIYLATAVAFCR